MLIMIPRVVWVGGGRISVRRISPLAFPVCLSDTQGWDKWFSIFLYCTTSAHWLGQSTGWHLHVEREGEREIHHRNWTGIDRSHKLKVILSIQCSDGNGGTYITMSYTFSHS